MNGRLKLSWRTRITILYSSFVVFIIGLAAFASLQSFNLVEKDYYAKELAYQERIDKIRTTEQNPGSISAGRDNETGILRLEFDNTRGALSGTIRFFRPSDQALDFAVALAVDESGIQLIDTSEMRAGLWRIKIDWTAGEHEYYYEDMLILE